MIVAVFFFFILVGLFFLAWQSRSLTTNFEDLQKEQALSSIEVIANMPELNCDSEKSLCLDEDKLNVLTGNLSNDYNDFWPVESVRVYRIYPAFSESGKKKCPSLECNYWEIYDSAQELNEQDESKDSSTSHESSQEFSSYVNICKNMKEAGYVYSKCEVGKLVVGARLAE